MIDYNVRGEVIFTEWNGFKREIYIKNLETNKNFWAILNNNWRGLVFTIGDKGYFHIEEVKSGEQYTKPDGTTGTYKYDGVYIIDFIPE